MPRTHPRQPAYCCRLLLWQCPMAMSWLVDGATGATTATPSSASALPLTLPGCAGGPLAAVYHQPLLP